MPVKEIKIDKSFVMDMDNNSNNAMIVHATIDLGHNLGLEVIGEGVESNQIMSHLQNLGCDSAQGFYLTRPLDEKQFSDWLKQSETAGILRVEDGQVRVLSAAQPVV